MLPGMKVLLIVYLALFCVLIGDLGTQTNPTKYWAFMAMDLSIAGYCMYQLLRDAWRIGLLGTVSDPHRL
jgi:hypothetical protein